MIRRRGARAPWRRGDLLDAALVNIKMSGYQQARALAAALPPPPAGGARAVNLSSKPATQADLQTDWAAHWASQLKIAPVFHRKVWEYVFVLQALHDGGVLEPGRRGLGFGCGREPLASYFAARGIDVTVTDLPQKHRRSAGWGRVGQHLPGLQAAHQPHLVDEATFLARADYRGVDMNRLPPDLAGYDFCWSICALEHLGDVKRGLAFVERAMATLKPGGVAVHTTEFNFLDDERTVERGRTVLFQKRHFEALARRLEAAGHTVAPLDFSVGADPLDQFIDMPPYPADWTEAMKAQWGIDALHLKLMLKGYPCTCFGLIVTRGAA